MADFVSTFKTTAQTIAKTYGVPVSKVEKDLAARWNQRRGVGGYGDDALSSILPDTSTMGLFGAPAVALYSFGAVILGIGLFVALKKKK